MRFWGGASTATYKLFEIRRADGIEVNYVNLIGVEDTAFFRGPLGDRAVNPKQLLDVWNCFLNEPTYNRHPELEFNGRVGEAVEPALILVGERNLGDVSEIVPLATHRAFKAMVKYVIVGLGVYQGLEFMLERGLWELLGKGGVAASRLYNSLRLLARAPAYRFVLGRSKEKNSQTLFEFIHQQCS